MSKRPQRLLCLLPYSMSMVYAVVFRVLMETSVLPRININARSISKTSPESSATNTLKHLESPSLYCYSVFTRQRIKTQKKSFQVKHNHTSEISKRQPEISTRLARSSRLDKSGPVLSGGNEELAMGHRVKETNHGGIALIHRLVRQIGLAEEINSALSLLKNHCPYHESDHILNIADKCSAVAVLWTTLKTFARMQPTWMLLGPSASPIPPPLVTSFAALAPETPPHPSLRSMSHERGYGKCNPNIL